jgi:hypothetical protein
VCVCLPTVSEELKEFHGLLYGYSVIKSYHNFVHSQFHKMVKYASFYINTSNDTDGTER